MCTIRSKSKVVFWPLRQNCFPLPRLVRYYQLQRYLHRLSLNIKNSNNREVVWTKLARGVTIVAQIEICLSDKTFAQYCSSVQPGRGDCDCERTGKGANYEINSLEFIHDQLFSYFDSTGQWRWVATEQKGKKKKIPHYFLIWRQFLLIHSCPFSSRKNSSARSAVNKFISGLFYYYQYSPPPSITLRVPCDLEIFFFFKFEGY